MMNDHDTTPHARGSWLHAAGQRLAARFAPERQHIILFLLLGVMLLSSLAPLAMAGWGIAPTRPAQVSAGTPNLFDPHSQANSISHPQVVGPHAQAGPQAPPATTQRPLPVPMQPALVPLLTGQAVHFLGSDGLLEVDLPAGAVTPEEVQQAAGGQLSLKIMQLTPPSGSSAGGSGHVSLGSYLLQVVDATGTPVAFGLNQPVTLALHTKTLGVGLNLAETQVVFNGGTPTGALGADASSLGSLHSQTATLDPSGHTLQVSTELASASTSVSFNTDAPVAAFGSPDPFNTDLSAGALTFNEPISVPAGPGGLAPPLTLAYSSDAVSEQHNVQAAAGWVGEGWNLSLGEISWAEHNVYAHCYTPCSGPFWNNSWQLSDPFGTSAELIPPTSGVSTYYDDSTNLYYSNGSYPNQPVLWHTSDESHLKIYSYVGPNTLPNMPAHVSCFRVYLPNGLMEEYGCTPDSIEYYFQPGSNGSLNSYFIANWLLDLITDPQGNQIHVTYQADMSSFQGWTYTRDVVPATVSWDSPGCHNSQSACTGSAWAPLLQVSFVASHSVARKTPLQSGWPCNTGTNLRCDDPLDESASGGVPAPLVQNTFVLNDLQVQVRSSGTGSWNTLTDYQLSYEQTGAGTFTDPVSGTQESFAGALDLTQIQEVGDTGSKALLYSGNATSSTSADYAYMQLFDLSSQHIVIGPQTTLSYWIYPQSSATSPVAVSGSNSTCVAIDMLFTDGSDLRDSGAVDQHGNRLHPAYQCGHLTLDQWNLVTANIGASLNGKTISQIDEGYDHPDSTGGYRGYIDDINLTNPDSSTPLWSSGFESGDPQLTWRNTGAPGPSIMNVSGICCGLTGPESWADNQVTTHWGSTALPPRTFSYVSLREHYVDSFGPTPLPAGNCGWGWNGNPNCYLWFESLDSNGRYISSASNGQGLAQTFTWAEAHDNSHGFGWWADSTDPLYCNSNSNNACAKADDQAWSHIVLTSQSSSVVRPSSSGNVTVTSTTSYSYRLSILTAHPWSDGVTGMYWGNQNDADYLDFYNNIFMGFAQATVTHPDGSVDVNKYYATEGIGLYDTGQVSCYGPGPCNNDPWWDPGNALHGRLYEADHFDVDGTTLLQQDTLQYQLTCPPSGVGGTPASGWGNYDGHLVSQLDRGNPVAVCDIRPSQSQTITFDGPDFSSATSYEAESSVNTLTGGAQIQACSACSGGQQVDWVGQSATVQFNQITVPSAGTYALTLYYSNGDAGSVPANASVNGGHPILLSFASTGSWFTVGTLVIAVALQAGNNTVLLGNPAGGAPNFDRLTVSASRPVVSTTSNTYDSYGRIIATTATSSDGTTSVKGTSPTTIIQTTSYIWNDALTPTLTGVTGTYLINVVAFTDTEDTAGNRYSCSYLSYDGQGYATGQQSSLTLGEATTADTYTACGTTSNGSGPSELLRTTTTYDQYGNVVATTDADANAGNSAHVGCTVGSSHYSACRTYDGTFASLPTSDRNALNQTSTSNYTATAAGGFGLWPTSGVDLNGQAASMTYDPLGRVISTTLPGETSGLTTSSTSYTDWCSGTTAQAPCVEIDATSRLDSSTTITSRAFYDGEGHLVETRSPAPDGQDVVQYHYYDPSGRAVFTSSPYEVTAYAGVPGPAAFATPDAAQPGTSTTYSNLRSTKVTDVLSHTTTTTDEVECGYFGDPACYVLTTTYDPLNHKSNALTDAWGRTAYTRTNTGNSSSTYQAYADVQYGYNYLGKVAWVGEPNGTSNSPTGAYVTYTYDAAGRLTSMTDPDLGTSSFSYDQNGNLIQSVDARGSAGTVFIGYDGLDRVLWRNTTNSPTGAFATYGYDSTANGNLGIGRLTGETFSNGPLSGAYSNVYDARGQTIQTTMTLGGTNYVQSATYDDAGTILTQTYPDGEVVTASYNGQGALAGLATQQGSTTTTLLSQLSYGSSGGAVGKITSAVLGNTYQYSASYDLLGRPTSTQLQLNAAPNTLIYKAQPNYDTAGNVTKVTTTLPGGTDVQQFCYDELNRLTWAGSVGTPPCTGTAITPGTLTSAQYQQSFSYDNLNRLTSGPLGTYTYGDSAHLHAVTSIGSGYTASYDAAGDMTCRAPTSSSTCAGAQTGAQLSYDAEGQLVGWQNAPSSPTSTTSNLYDGEGNRVEQQVTQNGVTTTTFYVGNAEDVTKSGATTTTTTYYYAGGARIALAVNGVISYLANDGLGSATVALSANGTVQASQLYGPYGTLRYSSGTMPGSYGFTGQHTDATTGLDYYNARYYDPQAGRFISADMVQGNPQGMDPYAYVNGNPETLTDPTGNYFVDGGGVDPIDVILTIAAGAFLGAVSAASADLAAQMIEDYQHGWPLTNIDWGQVGIAAAVGALAGAAWALIPGASMFIGALVGLSVFYLMGGAPQYHPPAQFRHPQEHHQHPQEHQQEVHGSHQQPGPHTAPRPTEPKPYPRPQPKPDVPSEGIELANSPGGGGGGGRLPPVYVKTGGNDDEDWNEVEYGRLIKQQGFWQTLWQNYVKGPFTKGLQGLIAKMITAALLHTLGWWVGPCGIMYSPNTCHDAGLWVGGLVTAESTIFISLGWQSTVGHIVSLGAGVLLADYIVPVLWRKVILSIWHCWTTGESC